ncbi:MAG TPA: Eco57I restriction-modification methylase domain-containing protein, partial [Candidatus Paceibacterota bacterium]|nr:Eco57I restriction-modification methylase domain-containing protein [Candidatus Paceibacterota bacterium]
NDIYGKRIIDPACGNGAFLIEVLKRFLTDVKKTNLSQEEIKDMLEKNIIGFDIDNQAINECISNLNNVALKYNLKNIKWQIIKTDSLNKSFVSQYFNSFDFVVGNPPYIRIQHLGRERRKNIQNDWYCCKNGSTDIFITFFELGFSLLNKNGQLGYITPNTYLKTNAGESLREFIKISKSLKTLIDFEYYQLFKNTTTYSIITILDKNHHKNTFSLYKSDGKNINYIDDININNLDKRNWVLAPNNVLDKLKKIETRGMPLNKIAKIHVGITTLADDFYIFKDIRFNNNYAEIKLKDGRTFQIEKDILKPIIKVSVLKNANENQNRFIIFPYKKINGRHVIIPENELKSRFPLTYKYFLAIKKNLDSRDKGKPNPITWYAYGRSQGLDTSFGKKILTSSINLKPNFIVWEKEEYTFYAGYCIKFDGDLKLLAKYLNSPDMEFYINHTSRNYRNNYKSFAKSFIERFGITNLDLIKTQTLFENKI